MKRFVLDIEIFGRSAGDLFSCQRWTGLVVVNPGRKVVESVVAYGSIALCVDVGVRDLRMEAAEEERLDKLTARSLRKGRIEGARIANELDGCSGAFGAVTERFIGAAKAFLDDTFLECDLLELFAQPWHGKIPVGEGVDEACFLIGQSRELGL